MMERDEFARHWNYLCSLDKLLEETDEYVYHGTDGEQLEQGNVYSNAFKRIIILAASEFETMGKNLCKSLNETIDSHYNILNISKTILDKYPLIKQTVIQTRYWKATPLEKWMIVKQEDGNEKVEGLEWWNAYNALKHDEENSYKKATLKNAIEAVGSLYILDLYMIKIFSGNLHFVREQPTSYIRNDYVATQWITDEGQLPDFGNKTRQEVIEEKYKL